MRPVNIKQRLVIGVTSIGMLALAACSSGVAQADYNAVKDQLAAEQQKSAAYQKELSDKIQENTALAQKAADQAKQPAGGGPAGVTVLMGAKAVPTAPPAPKPTAPPADYTPPPKPVAPASYYESVGPFFIYVEVLQTGHASKYNIASTANCVPGSIFKRGQRVVWRFEIIDTSTGKRLTDKDDAKVTIKMPNGDEASAHFTQRAGGSVPDAPWMWNGIWDIPLDYPLGGVDYSIVVAAKDGRTVTWKQPALVSKTTDTRMQIIE